LCKKKVQHAYANTAIVGIMIRLSMRPHFWYRLTNSSEGGAVSATYLYDLTLRKRKNVSGMPIAAPIAPARAACIPSTSPEDMVASAATAAGVAMKPDVNSAAVRKCILSVHVS
jgi:hypothetical protein